MHFFVAEISQQNPATFQILIARAQGIYRENLDAYIRLVLRQPLSKIIVRIPPCVYSIISRQIASFVLLLR